jgi:hypothetical protein
MISQSSIGPRKSRCHIPSNTTQKQACPKQTCNVSWILQWEHQ